MTLISKSRKANANKTPSGFVTLGLKTDRFGKEKTHAVSGSQQSPFKRRRIESRVEPAELPQSQFTTGSTEDYFASINNAINVEAAQVCPNILSWVLVLILVQSDQERILLAYKEKRIELLDLLLNSQSSQGLLACVECSGKDKELVRCTSCFQCPVYCPSCLLSSHGRLPFHCVERWTGTHFMRTTLATQGYVLHLHRGPGPCDGDCTSNMTIIAANGIHELQVQQCMCVDLPVFDQLMKLRLFPATFDRPATAFTFEVLDQYLADYSICKTTAYSFYEKLRHITDPLAPNDLPDRYRELMRTSREWMDLKLRLRAGQADSDVDKGGAGSLVIRCVACPRPGVNIPSAWDTDKRR
jgi:ferredoxin